MPDKDIDSPQTEAGPSASSIASHEVLDTHHNTATRVLEGRKTIEIAGYTILAVPLESMALTPEQQKKFTQPKEGGGIGGFEIDCSRMSEEGQIQFAKDNPEAPIDWQVSFEESWGVFNCVIYRGFELFKKLYRDFPDIASMTKEEAIEAGFYPVIHYRNFAARKWMAEMNGGRLATLDENSEGELRDIYNAAPGETNLEKFSAMGQVQFGWRGAHTAKAPQLLGDWVTLASGSLHHDDYVYAFDGIITRNRVERRGYVKADAVSSIVILPK